MGRLTRIAEVAPRFQIPAQTQIFSSISIIWHFISPFARALLIPLAPFSSPPALARHRLSLCCGRIIPLSRDRKNLAPCSSPSFRHEGGKSKAEPKKNDSRLSVKRKASEGAGRKPAKKAGKDPNKPKRPPSAFFVFMEEFRKQFQEKNPHNKSVATVGKAGGAKWKSLSEAEKAPYVNKANKRKADFQKAMADYEKKKEAGNQSGEEENESDRSKSEVHDEEEDEESGDDEEDEE